jgi:hypothetical protein
MFRIEGEPGKSPPVVEPRMMSAQMKRAGIPAACNNNAK